MLYVLSGKDAYSKNKFIEGLSQKAKTNVVKLEPGIDPRGFTGGTLFGGAGVYTLLPGEWLKQEETLHALASSENDFVYFEPSGNKAKVVWPGNAVQKKFDPLKVAELPVWIDAYAKEKGKAVDLAARNYIVESLFGKPAGFGEVETDLYLLSSELDKLFLVSDKVTLETAKQLVSQSYDPGVFQLLEMLSQKNRVQFFKLFEAYFTNLSPTDLQGRLISFCALLAEQMRGFLLVHSGMPESEILEVSGWKSGRLFIVKKQAVGFSPQVVVQTLKKLEAFDEELKTGHPAPLPILTLIVSQLF
ncbi:MAG TPA: hypothetical protein VEA59_01655 [Patescibacteria group bacterium]|nr:hypothetical protein [Patescibacteria group bacterium]